MKTLDELDSLDELDCTAATSCSQGSAYPLFTDFLPKQEIREGRYRARFARTSTELDAVLKLRFEVFNLELGEGLESSFLTSRDLDEFDQACHHLIVQDIESGRIVGTYRTQTAEMAAASRGFYSATEFDLSGLPDRVFRDSVELGRACVAVDHRNLQVLFMLWKGLASYVAHNKKRYLFGCCSLTSQNEAEGLRVMELLEREQKLHPDLSVWPHLGFQCAASELTDHDAVSVTLPKLFRTYLHYGAMVCGPPAIDRQFKTIDFLVLFDVFEMDAQNRRTFFGD